MKQIDFWFDYSSTYTYLTVARIGAIVKDRNLALKWHPFLLQPVMAAVGLPRGPFQPFPDKQRYMWRDIERRALELGVPYLKPTVYPPDTQMTTRIGLLAEKEGWCDQFTEAVFHAHWTEGLAIGSEENINRSLRILGRSVELTCETVNTDYYTQALHTQIERARALGIFGSPSFIVDGDLFWGDDRLESALSWAGV